MSISPLQSRRVSLLVSSWLTFAVSLTFYWITADPGVSYWDCAEYVTSASKLEIGHPPGNPVWMLAMRVATIPFPEEYHAYVINLFSGLFMAFAAFFLCKTIFFFLSLSYKKIKGRKVTNANIDIMTGIVASGASLCFALCDSVWFSAVEAEVYAMSAFLTSLSLWIMTEWWSEGSKSRQTRLLILLSYVTGLSLGVHQLNLLLIPVFAFIILYKRHRERISPLKAGLTLVISLSLLGIILMGYIPGMLFGAESFELWSVNLMGLPYDSGIIIFLILIVALIVISLLFLYNYHPLVLKLKNKANILATGIWMFTFLLLGFSSFGIILIRAKAAPFMNEGTPDNIFNLTSYLLREQYPSSPLLYGETPFSQPIYEETFEDGKPQYKRYILKKGKGIYQPYIPNAEINPRSGMLSKEDSLNNSRIAEKGKGYLLTDYKFTQRFTPELNMWLPRMTSRDLRDREAYADWGGMIKENMYYLPISETVDSDGNFQPRLDIRGERNPVYSYRPTHFQNLQYFVSYQAYYMYFRYLFWNFIGRQNDFHSNGEIDHGNFITGIPILDEPMLGDQENFPPEIWQHNKGRNRYFGIPFILGIIGIVWLASGNYQRRRLLTLITLFFLMTGLAIVFYLNQSPGEPRERDYTFLGSYMAFSMWIAAGMAALGLYLLKLKSQKLAFILIAIISLGTSALMATENFDDHDRRGRFEPSFYASSLLDFDYSSIIFSHGDNSTFPLWYASEVLDKGKNHTIIDITYLSLPSYINNLKKQGFKTIVPTSDILYNQYILTRIPPDSCSEEINLVNALNQLYESNKAVPEWPSSMITVPSGEGTNVVINLHDFSKGSSYLSFKHLMLLDILAQHIQDDKPLALYFPYLIDKSFYQPLDSLLTPTLFGKIYAPRLSEKEHSELLKKSVEKELVKLGKLSNRPHYIDPVIADRSVRYRGELILAADRLLDSGYPVHAIKISHSIEKNYPYETLLPGSFKMGDTTFYEGREYVKLLKKLYNRTGNKSFDERAEKTDSIISRRNQEWLDYYHSLTPRQRKTLSNRSKRLLIK